MNIFPTKILLATDGSREAELASRTAADLAHNTGSELHMIHVIALPLDTHDPSSFEPESLGTSRKARTHEPGGTLVGRIVATGGAVEDSRLTAGRPDAEIVDWAEEIGADLIVMGSRGVGRVRRALFGSVSN